MSAGRCLGALRAATVLAALGAGTAVTWRWGAPDRAAALSPDPTLVQLITAVAAVALPLAMLWLTLLVALIGLEPLAGRRLTGLVGCPPALRRALVGLVGAAVVGALAVPAEAAPGKDGGRSPERAEASERVPERVPGLLDGLPLPTRPTGISPRTAGPGAAGAPALTAAASAMRTAAATAAWTGDRTTTVVRSGDSLWRIAARRSPGASDAQLVQAVARLYATNRDRIGADPDLIQPGIALRFGVDADTSQEDPS